VTISEELYRELRRYMVEHGLPHVRAALEAMIRGSLKGESHTQQEEVLGTQIENVKGGRQGGGPSHQDERSR
jgi:hypothetical protein